MYRLDYMTPADGLEPVRDVAVQADFICRRMTRARERAECAAASENMPVLITRIGKTGHLKPSLVMLPDGTSKRPPGSQPVNERDDCKGDDQPCFCPRHRALRRERRNA